MTQVRKFTVRAGKFQVTKEIRFDTILIDSENKLFFKESSEDIFAELHLNLSAVSYLGALYVAKNLLKETVAPSTERKDFDVDYDQSITVRFADKSKDDTFFTFKLDSGISMEGDVVTLTEDTVDAILEEEWLHQEEKRETEEALREEKLALKREEVSVSESDEDSTVEEPLVQSSQQPEEEKEAHDAKEHMVTIEPVEHTQAHSLQVQMQDHNIEPLEEAEEAEVVVIEVIEEQPTVGTPLVPIEDEEEPDQPLIQAPETFDEYEVTEEVEKVKEIMLLPEDATEEVLPTANMDEQVETEVGVREGHTVEAPVPTNIFEQDSQPTSLNAIPEFPIGLPPLTGQPPETHPKAQPIGQTIAETFTEALQELTHDTQQNIFSNVRNENQEGVVYLQPKVENRTLGIYSIEGYTVNFLTLHGIVSLALNPDNRVSEENQQEFAELVTLLWGIEEDLATKQFRNADISNIAELLSGLN